MERNRRYDVYAGIKNPGCNFRETTLKKNLNKYYAKNVVIKGTSVDVDAEGQSVTIAATVTGTNGILNGQAATFSSPILIRPMAGVDAIDVKSNVEASVNLFWLVLLTSTKVYHDAYVYTYHRERQMRTNKLSLSKPASVWYCDLHHA